MAVACEHSLRHSPIDESGLQCTVRFTCTPFRVTVDLDYVWPNCWPQLSVLLRLYLALRVNALSSRSFVAVIVIIGHAHLHDAN